MASPFVISMRFEADGSSVTSTTADMRREIDGLGTVLDAAAGSAANLNTKAIGAATAIAQLGAQRQRLAALSANGINQRLGVRDEFDTAARAADIQAYGRQLDALRARYNPLYSAIRQYRTETAAIRDAHRIGAISADEMTAAIGRERSATLASIAAIKQRGQALTEGAGLAMRGASANVGAFNTANIAAQFQDIGVTSAMGMSPLQIALQQGTQLSAVFEQLKGQGQSVGSALASAFASVVSPISLITIGAVAAGSAIIQWGFSTMNAAEDATDALEKHSDWLDEILVGYDSAREAARRAAKAAETLPQGAVQSDLRAEQGRDQAAYAAAVDGIRQANIALRVSELELYATRESGLETAIAQGEALVQLQAGYDGSAGSLANLIVELTELKNNAADEVIRSAATELLALANAAKAADVEVKSTAASLAELNNAALLLNVAKGADVAFNAIDRLRALAPDLRSEYEKANDLLNEALGSSQDGIVRDVALRQYTDTIAALDEQAARQEAERAARVAEAEAKKRSAYEQTLGTVAERLGQMELETSLIGATTYASERARIVFELENAARKDAIGLSNERIIQIHAEADAYAAAAVRREEMTEREREGREEMEFYRSTFRSFFTGFLGDVAKGESVWESLGNAAVNALDRIADRALGMAADGIFDMLYGALVGGLTGGLTPKPVTNIGFGSYGSFDTGGWTGGSRGRVAGLVHGEEFVVRAGPAAANRGMLEAMNAGQPVGVGRGDVLIEVHNHTGQPVREERSKGAGGVDVVRLIIGTVKGAIADGSMDGALAATYGLKRRTS